MEPPAVEEPLAGGNMNADVVRVGDTVRRHPGPQATTVHRLLAHVRSAGIGWVPEPAGFDDQGREVVGFLPGRVPHGEPGWLWDGDHLVDAVRALRAFHDATKSFARSPGDVWWFPGKRPDEVICHNDWAPYNHVFVGGRWSGAIDFDLCYPAPRVWDLAWTVYRYVPLRPQPGREVAPAEVGEDVAPLPDDELARRLTLAVETYGPSVGSMALDPPDVPALLGVVAARLEAIAAWCREQASPDLRRNGDMYAAHARWISGGAFGPTVTAAITDLTA